MLVYCEKHIKHLHISCGKVWFLNVTAGKGKAAPLQAWSGPEGSRNLRLPDYMKRHRKVVRLSILRTGRRYPQEMLLYLCLSEAESTPGP